MKQAVEDHEKVHFEDWQTELNKTFPKMKTTIENLTVDHECGKTTAADALDALRTMTSYSRLSWMHSTMPLTPTKLSVIRTTGRRARSKLSLIR